MTDVPGVRGRPAPSPSGDREIGPLGTIARILAGIAALLLLAVTEGLSVWNLGTGLVGLPIVATLALRGLSMLHPDAISGDGDCRTVVRAGPCTTECLLLALVALLVVGVGFVTPITEGAILIWLGVSFLLAAFLGYEGCELVAIPNLLTGRQDRLPCFLFNPIDRVEARSRQRSTRRTGTAQGEQGPSTLDESRGVGERRGS